MLIEPMIQQLQQLRLRGMAAALDAQLRSHDNHALSFEERLGLLIQHEVAERANLRLAQRLRWARLPQSSACIEDIDARAPRGVDAMTFAAVRDLSWIKKRLNVLITGACGWERVSWRPRSHTPPAAPTSPYAASVCRGSRRSSHERTRCNAARLYCAKSPRQMFRSLTTGA